MEEMLSKSCVINVPGARPVVAQDEHVAAECAVRERSFSAVCRTQDVLRDSTLSQSDKRDLLRRWALDAYLIELAQSDTAPTTSRLDEVIEALITLDDTELRRTMSRQRNRI